MRREIENPVVIKAANENPLAIRVITSEMLFAGARELVIKHRGEDYRLRLTSQDKLILTK